MGGCSIDPREGHHLCAEFSKLLRTLGTLLDKCTDVDDLKAFLFYYCHPLYPNKHYIEPHIYSDAKTVKQIVFCLFPHYINYMEHYLLKEIVTEYGTHVCREHFNQYEQCFLKSFGKLRHHPAPVTDEEIENSIGQTRLRVMTPGDPNATNFQDIKCIQGAIHQAVGTNPTGQVFAHQDPGNSIIFTFLIPDCIVQLFHELSYEDLNVLAEAGVTKIQVEEWDIVIARKPTIKRMKRIQITLPVRATSSEVLVKPNSLEYFLNERQEFPSHERSVLTSMVNAISDSQLDEVCSEDLLLKFSSYIQNWKTLAPFLGLQEIYYDEFFARYPRVEEQKYQLLLLWKNREGNDAIYLHLLETVIVHGKADEVKALIDIKLDISHTIASNVLGNQLKRKYIQHADTSKNNGRFVDTRLVQLNKNASNALKELDYSTKLETVEEFKDSVNNMSPKQVINVINAAKPGSCISITGPRGIGKTAFIRRMCNCWALGSGLWHYKLLFWIDLSTARDQAFVDVFEVLHTALTPIHTFTKAELENALRHVVKTKGEHVLIVLDHFNQQYNQLLSNLVSLKLFTVVVSSSHAIKSISCNVHFHVLGLTDRQVSQLALQYYCSDYSKAEHFLQYLSSVPNFSNLRRVPVYLLGLLFVFDVTSATYPPKTLMSFLSCLILIMLNPPRNELKQIIENLASKPLFDAFSRTSSPSLSRLQIVSNALFVNSKSLFHETELTAMHTTPAFVRPVQVALPLMSGKWLQFTQYPLLNDFLASFHLYNQRLPATQIFQHLTARKELQYFCLKIMPHICEQFRKQTEVNYILIQTSYMYEAAENFDGNTTETKLYNTAVSALTMYSLTSAISKIEFIACDFSPAAATILSNTIGNGSHLEYHWHERIYARYVDCPCSLSNSCTPIHTLLDLMLELCSLSQ